MDRIDKYLLITSALGFAGLRIKYVLDRSVCITASIGDLRPHPIDHIQQEMAKGSVGSTILFVSRS